MKKLELNSKKILTLALLGSLTLTSCNTNNEEVITEQTEAKEDEMISKLKNLGIPNKFLNDDQFIDIINELKEKKYKLDNEIFGSFKGSLNENTVYVDIYRKNNVVGKVEYTKLNIAENEDTKLNEYVKIDYSYDVLDNYTFVSKNYKIGFDNDKIKISEHISNIDYSNYDINSDNMNIIRYYNISKKNNKIKERTLCERDLDNKFDTAFMAKLQYKDNVLEIHDNRDEDNGYNAYYKLSDEEFNLVNEMMKKYGKDNDFDGLKEFITDKYHLKEKQLKK